VSDGRNVASAVREVVELLEARSILSWLRGGWALDFFLGGVTRPHEDIDLFIWAADADAFTDVLATIGFGAVLGPPPEEQRNFIREGVVVHTVLLERTPHGALVTAGGRFDDLPWPDEMVGTTRGLIGDLAARIVNPSALLYSLEAAPREGNPIRGKYLRDLELLRSAMVDQD
jgi:hypothetical protein